MTVRSLCGWAVLSLALGCPAAAAPATPEEAQRLTDLFQRYVGKPAAGQPSAVTVTPAGESYRADLDLTRLAAPLRTFGFNIAATTTLAATLTPQADGAWRVQADGFPALAFTKDDQTTTLKYEGYKVDGVFDPKLEAVRSATSTLSGLTAGSVAPQASSQQHYTAQVTSRQTGHDAGDGSVDTEMHQTAADLTYAMSTQAGSAKDANGTVTFLLNAKAASASTDTALSHISMTSLMDLWAFLVAHPSKPALIADQAGLKALLLATLKADPHGSSAAEVQQLAVTTPVGPVAVDHINERFEFGDKASGRASFGLHYAGLRVPADQLPPWAVGLVPTALDLDLAVGPFHVNDGLSKAVTDLDLSADKPLPDAQAADVMLAMGGPGALTVTLAPTTITSAMMTVRAQASLRMGPGNQPIGRATVTASGLDEALSKLNGSSQDDPTAAQVAAVLTLAKQVGKAAGPGLYSWTLDAEAGKPVTVNGTPLPGAAPDGDATDPDPSTEP